jgi:branched-chain amino acid aminotransferase
MNESEFIWVNGKLEPWHEANIHVLSHGLHYGTGIFEGIRCFKTPDGAAIFRLKEHIARLFDSASIYKMKMPFNFETVVEAVKETVMANKLEECYIRPIAYYGYGEMGVNPLPNRVNLAIAAWYWPSYLGERAEREGARVQVSSWRRIPSQSMPPQAKCTANYANASLAKIEAIEAGYDESIMLNMEGMVTEATAENVFRVKDGILTTPPASDGALRGITRDTVIELAKELGIEFRRNEISREELYTSSELFLTGTAAGVTPVREVDGRKIGNGSWPLTMRIKKTYEDTVHGKNPKYSAWLDRVQLSTVPQIPLRG